MRTPSPALTRGLAGYERQPAAVTAEAGISFAVEPGYENAWHILADTFPPERRGLAFALFGVTVVVAPILGPTLGGWITDNYTWRWIFLINLPVGIVASFLVYRLVEDPPWEKRLEAGGLRIDYVGVALLVLGVGALQIMLDKGQEQDWFAYTEKTVGSSQRTARDMTALLTE